MSVDLGDWLQDERPGPARQREGFHVTEVLDLPEPVRQLMIEVARREPATLTELATALARDSIEVEVLLNQLVSRGWVEIDEDASGEWVYRAKVTRSRKRVLPPGIWQVIDDRWHVPVFRLFSDPIREQFSRCFHLQTFEPGSILFSTGSWGERMYVVERGKIELLAYNESGEEFVVRELEAGEVFGEMGVLLGERRPYTARAVDTTQVWTLTQAELRLLLTQHPPIGLTLRQELARRLRHPPRSDDLRECHCPILVVGGAAGEVALSLAEQLNEPVVVVDLVGTYQDVAPRLMYHDGRTLHSSAVLRLIAETTQSGAWVVVIAPPEMSDLTRRVAPAVKVAIDLTGGRAAWLQSAAGDYWALSLRTPTQIQRLARRLCGRVTGLVLSGGVARTIAHLGVLEVLHQAQIPVDVIASCGFGAFWGVLYAAGWTPQGLIELALQGLSRLQPFGARLGFRALARSGLFDARSVRRWVQEIVGDRDFSDLEIPCRLVASSLTTGEQVEMKEGRLFPAISACLAIPGLITPVQYSDRILADAMLQDPLPADAISTAEADVVLASSVISMPSSERVGADRGASTLVSTWLDLCATVGYERSLAHLDKVDAIIVPDVGELTEDAFDRASLLIERGREAAQQALPRIRACLREG